MLVAYHRTEGARRLARVELERKTGHVTVWAREDGVVDPETGERSEPGPEFDDTPAGFGRIAASTARQVIVQRLRDIEDEAIMGDFHGREGDIITGVIQQSSDPRYVMVDLGAIEGSLLCWMTPVMMSPSRPWKSPMIASSSRSRSRCTMTCLAVEAAIRPKPAGVSSNSGPGSKRSSVSRPVAPSSRAQTVT